MTATPFDDILDLLNRLPEARAAAPQGGRGDGFADLASWLLQWSGKSSPEIRRPLVAIYAGAHGIASHGISTLPASVARDLVEQSGKGASAISRLCQEFDLGLKVFDLALELPTADFTVAPALDERSCAATMAFGMEALADGTDVLCLGAIGAGGSTAAAALLAALHGGQASDWQAEAGAAVDARRATVIKAGLTLHGEFSDRPFELLRLLGGREIAAIAGAILAARFQSVPVILADASGLAAAAVLAAARPDSITHCRLAAPGGTQGLSRLASALGLEPVLGRTYGSGGQGPLDGALAVATLKAAAAIGR